MKYIDIHGHVNFSDYKDDLYTVLDRAKAADVGIITIGTDLESSRQAVELAEKHDNMWATVGIHPTSDISFDFAEFKKLALHPKVVAIGECGLDYFHSKSESGADLDIDSQRNIFIKHIELANEVNKPLMLHIRNSKEGSNIDPNTNTDVNTSKNVSAYQEAVSLLKKYAKVRANFHFFAGIKEDVQAILDIGGMVSFTGVITFARNYDEVIKYIPLDRVMSETDCPFVSPVPYRGKRNEPSYVVEVVKAIANIRGDGEVAVSRQLVDNAVNFFGLK